MASAILKKLSRIPTGLALMVVLPSILLGAILSGVLRATLDGGGIPPLMDLLTAQWFSLALILFIVFMRIRQRPTV